MKISAEVAVDISVLAAAALPAYTWVRAAIAMVKFNWHQRSKSFSFGQMWTNQTFMLFGSGAMYSDPFLTDDQRALLASWLPVRRRLIHFILSLPVSIVVGVVVLLILRLYNLVFDNFNTVGTH